MEISAKCGYLSLLTWQPYVHALAPQWINALAFWKHQLACSLAISTSICSQKSVIYQVFTCERAKGRERERDAMYVCIFTLTIEAVALIPLETIMLLCYQLLVVKDNVCNATWSVCVWAWDLVKTAHEFRTLLIFFFFNVESVLICAIITYQQC